MTTLDGTVPPDDVALARTARDGDMDAFAELVRRHQGRVRGFVAGYVRDPMLVDDVAQEVFVVAHRSLREWREEAPLRVWLLAIARRQALLHMRAEVRRRRRQDALSLQIDEWDLQALEAAPVASYDERVSALRRCMEQLSAGSAELLRQHYFEGKRLADIARARGKREGTIKVQLFRIRQALAICMGRALSAGEPP
jgi:RNA polymerase sigma factor (sigma-70 family)